MGFKDFKLAFVFCLLATSLSVHAATYTLVEEFSGQDFFSHFNFETLDDPTWGFVDYVSEGRANYLKLLSYDNVQGSVRMKVDTTPQAEGRGRSSLRLRSKTTFNQGLFIFDVNHMPEGNGVWPALWAVGDNWPYNGEIDVIEGVNNQPQNQSTLHTGPGCNIPTSAFAQMTGKYIVSLNCNQDDGATGCTTQGPANSFGPVFNQTGGGVFALLWTKEAISVWFWPRNQVPSGLRQSAPPDPSQWGLPVSYFPLGDNCPSSLIHDQNLIINTDFCGGWGGRNFVAPDGSQGQDACNYYVSQNGAAFVNSYWDIQSIRMYSIRE